MRWVVFLMGLLIVGTASRELDAASSTPTSLPAVPSFGMPYSSSAADGGLFRGTISIDKFVPTSDGLAATGRLLFVRGGQVRSISTRFPVEVRRADCYVLELAIGPPAVHRQLLNPLVLVETPETNPMRHADFCEMGQELAEGDFVGLARAINEEELLEAGFLGGNSCPWYRWAECGGTLVGCTAVCILTTPTSVIGATACFLCIGASLYDLCKDCIQKL